MGHVGGGPTSTDVQWDSGGSKSPIREHLVLFGLERYWLLDSPHVLFDKHLVLFGLERYWLLDSPHVLDSPCVWY